MNGISLSLLKKWTNYIHTSVYKFFIMYINYAIIASVMDGKNLISIYLVLYLSENIDKTNI